MFGKLFYFCRHDSSREPSSSTLLKQTLEMLKEKESVLQKKIDIEIERAKLFTKTKQNQALAQSMKRKKFYETKIQQLWKCQAHIHDQEQKMQAKPPNPQQRNA